MSAVDGFEHSLLEGLHSLDQVILDGVELEVLRASGEFESVRVSEVRLVRRIHMFVIGVLDRAESVAETVQVVVGQKLLVKVVVARALTDLTFLSLSDSLLLVLHRGLLLSLLES